MSYSSARANAQNAAGSSSNPQQAIQYLAEAITALSRAVEKDIADHKRDIAQLKHAR